MVQWWNAPAIRAAARLLVRPSLAVPHLHVQDISKVNFAALRDSGIECVVFDKDNCLTRPYALTIEPHLQPAWDECRRVFGENVVIYSNSAGSADDKNHVAAQALETSLGAKILRHASKKPNGIEYVNALFPTLRPPQMAMIGDRMLTDICFGNMNGLLTVLTNPITSVNDNVFAAKFRLLEHQLLPVLGKFGVRPPQHSCLSTYLTLTTKSTTATTSPPPRRT